ncbi:tRNA-(ms[2]io[6]A)-hydroxylase [Prochlorococcus sp. MIT 1341]|uniref:tRNA-(ms[2]io[6]A)-hydroxylase n=1 Tax=Prochlorococcus sp. MIT 1341 TaxID=3096221 RepID=UPI002A74B08C|nr:tRNA-(ms[2]io[6]A)-hydroxylase [Prochlorococcus sp. MIT 1341]
MPSTITFERDLPAIKWLAAPSSNDWLSQAINNPLEVLIDHAHCERKAAGAALQLMFRYLCEPGLAEALTPLVKEELDHFEKVLALIKMKGRYLEPLPAPPYGTLLSKEITKVEPQRMLDSFLVAGLIEARSHERMQLLATNSPDMELRNLYAELMVSEARHFSLYWVLANERFEQKKVECRINELALIEASILSKLHHQPRMHS